MITVIHENKGDTNLRGHLGSELLNKAQSVIQVSIQPDNENASIVEAYSCRDKRFNPFAFEIDALGLPVLIDYTPASKSRPAAATPLNVSELDFKRVLVEAFSKEPRQGRSELESNLKLAFARGGRPVGNNKLRDFITDAKNKDMIDTEGTPGSRSLKYFLK